MAWWAAPDTALAGWDPASQDAGRAHSAQHLHRKILQEEGQAGNVVAGVHDDQDLGIAVRPLPGIDQPLDELACLAVTVAASSPGAKM
ncbi:hypothetical protein QFZ71_000409 [Streptomyces sp. V2I9]|nr:hypothetical protein [Streptomyces sp. V2I9]